MVDSKILITGGAGFVGSHLVEYLLKKTDATLVVFSHIDAPVEDHERVVYYRGNISSAEDVTGVFEKYGPFEVVYHLASSMPNKAVSDEVLWQTNVTGMEHIAAASSHHGVRSFIFTSSNVTYGIPAALPTTEDTPLSPLEIYGKSKAAAEQILEKYRGKMHIQIIRCPVITGVGRLGLQAILYEFISEDKNVYVLGQGANTYQFVDVDDVCSALYAASSIEGFDVYNIGADEPLPLRELYRRVIEFAGSTSKIVSLPLKPALFLLAVLDRINMSPLGVYQYTMMGRSLYTDTTKIKSKLGWQPKKTNTDTFIENYVWYKANKGTFVGIGSNTASDNRSLPRMGILKLLKMIS